METVKNFCETLGLYYFDFSMLQGGLTSLLLSQVSLVGYKLLIATFKKPSKHTFCLSVSFISRMF